MKLNRSVLVAVAVMVGSLNAIGCKSSATSAAPEVAKEQPALAAEPVQAATKPEATTIAASTTVRVAAPPPARIENQGRAPSANHSWERGYWRQDSARNSYVWVPGHWENQAAYAPSAPPPRRYEDPGCAPSADYFFVKGSWTWSGREYVWVGGHWDTRRDGYEYVDQRWEQVNGHWQRRSGYWAAQPRGYEDPSRRGGQAHMDTDRRGEQDRRAEQARQTERERQAEQARQAEKERQAEKNRQAEQARQAEKERQAEKNRQALRDRQAAQALTGPALHADGAHATTQHTPAANGLQTPAVPVTAKHRVRS